MSIVAATGTTTPGSAARPTATGTSLVSGTTSLDSDQPSDWQRDVDKLMLIDESRRVSRGGGRDGFDRICRAVYRCDSGPGWRCIYLGFRPAFRLKKKKKP